jgi:hypothetical protein
VILSVVQDTIEEEYGKIISQISGAALIEIEEHRLSSSGAVHRNVGVVAVASRRGNVSRKVPPVLPTCWSIALTDQRNLRVRDQ